MVLIRLPQIGNRAMKLRPALVLALLPGSYQNVLICGVSTKRQLREHDWDELIGPSDPDFVSSGLNRESSIRLSYLYGAERTEIAGSIGSIDPVRLETLRRRLAKHLS
jgi:mRNA interferase MazF